MKDTRKISLCLTNYNRYDMLIESFKEVLDDNRVSEIVISDDHSDINIFNDLKDKFKEVEKVRIFRNEKNVGMSLNKKISIELAQNQNCIIFDSDNVIDSSYLDALYKIEEWNTDTIYAPCFASPQFNYKEFSGMTFDKSNIKEFLEKPIFNCLVNTGNYLANRDRYLSVYEYEPIIKGCDAIYFNYLWLKKNGKLFVVPKMVYAHRVHEGSGFLKDADYNMKQAKEIKKLIVSMV